MAQMSRKKDGLKTRYLKVGISAWNGEITAIQDPKISVQELKETIDEDKLKRDDILVFPTHTNKIIDKD